MYEFKAPLLIVIEVTGNCNLHCKYCYAKSGCTSEYIDTSTIKSIVDESAELGVFDINICGGEPFLHDDIFEIISYIKSKGIDISLNTNATLIDKNNAIRLQQLDIIKNIQVSFDSHIENIHNKTRGMFAEAFKGFKLLCEHSSDGLQPIVGIVLNKYNFDTILDSIMFFSDYTKRFHIMNVMKNKHLELTDTQKDKFTHEILPQLRNLSLTNSISISQFKKHNIDFSLNSAHIDCLAGYTFIAITSSLDIIPCDIARKSIIKYRKYGDISVGYNKAKRLWKSRKIEWCKE